MYLTRPITTGLCNLEDNVSILVEESECCHNVTRTKAMEKLKIFVSLWVFVTRPRHLEKHHSENITSCEGLINKSHWKLERYLAKFIRGDLQLYPFPICYPPPAWLLAFEFAIPLEMAPRERETNKQLFHYLPNVCFSRLQLYYMLPHCFPKWGTNLHTENQSVRVEVAPLPALGIVGL